MATQTLNILLKTKKEIKRLIKNQNIIRYFIIIFIIWNLILSILAIGTISYLYKKAQLNYFIEVLEYEE